MLDLRGIVKQLLKLFGSDLNTLQMLKKDWQYGIIWAVAADVTRLISWSLQPFTCPYRGGGAGWIKRTPLYLISLSVCVSSTTIQFLFPTPVPTFHTLHRPVMLLLNAGEETHIILYENHAPIPSSRSLVAKKSFSIFRLFISNNAMALPANLTLPYQLPPNIDP